MVFKFTETAQNFQVYGDVFKLALLLELVCIEIC